MDLPSTPPQNTRKTHLTRDQRRDILVLSAFNHDPHEIAQKLGFSIRQVRYTLQQDQATPRRRSGRPTKLSSIQIDALEAFVCTNKNTRRMTYAELAAHLNFDVSPSTIRNALHSRGYHRRIAIRKPPISEANRVARLEWAKEHLHWTIEQWYEILWSDETWVTEGFHRRIYITRKAGEVLHPDCVDTKVKKKAGWMFWGCFSGITKGPVVFWEKEWGTINKTTYQEHIVPIVHGWIRLNPHLKFMQDNAPGHKAQDTRNDLKERGVTLIFWPAFSPDLNPIETVWNLMKDYIQRVYGDKKLSYDQLRKAVREAWDSIPPEELGDLINSMKDRCQAVIDANGMHIPY